MTGPPPSSIHLKALELLADGEWHSYEEILRQLRLAVPPGRAKRYQINSRRTAIYNAWKARGLELNDEELEARTKAPNDDDIRKGQRLIAGNILAKGKAFEIRPRGTQATADKRVRLVHDDTLLSVAEAAAILHMKAGTLSKWVEKGQIRSVKLSPRKLRLRRADVLALAREMGGEEILAEATLTGPQAAAYLGVERWNLSYWARTGQIPVVRVGDVMRHYRPADLDEFMAKGGTAKVRKRSPE